MRLRRRALGSVLACAALWPGPAAAVPRVDRPAYYSGEMRASAAQPYLVEPTRMWGGIAYSEVGLRHAPADLPPGSCRVTGAGYWLGDAEDHGSVVENAAPHPRHPPLGVNNPTASRTYDPPADPRGGDFGMDAALPVWTAECAADRRRGSAGAYDGAAETATAGALDPGTQTYAGVARTWMTRLETPGGSTASLSSILQVKHRRDADPRISYRLSVASPEHGMWTVGGVDIPLADLARQFAEQTAAQPVEGGAVLGMRITAPVAERWARGSVRFTAPGLCTASGLPAAREWNFPTGTLGHLQGVCFGLLQYEGTYLTATAPA